MSDETVKLPFWTTVRWSFQWGLAVAMRHQVTTAAFMAGGAMVGLLMVRDPMLAIVFGPAFSIATLALALLTHNEVLRGTAAFDQPTFGPGGVRVLTYLLDAIVLTLISALFTLVPLLLVLLLTSVVGGRILGILAEVVAIIAMIVLIARLALRLPSRALGTPMPWRAVWRLGTGNSMTLLLAPILLSLPLAVLPVLAALLSSEAFVNLLQWVLLPLQTILSSAFLAVAYGQLTAEASGTGEA